MGRRCSECECARHSHEFSGNQWRKGPGCSRCKYCVDGCNPSFQCQECNRCFENQNNLNMHMQVHRPRSVACPICGDTRFKSGANAVQHVESGYCSGCRGQDNAREQIYKFASKKQQMNRYLTQVPMITNGYDNHGSVPDFPYQCPECAKSFCHLSQLMQHQDQKHGNRRMIGY